MERKKWRTIQQKSTTIKPDPHSVGRENQKNIGTGPVDYWLWIMDQELRAVFGQ